MKFKKTIVMVLAVCAIVAGVIVLFNFLRDMEYSSFVKRTNKEVMAIMDGYVPEIKELFYENKEVFVKEIGKNVKAAAINVDGEKITVCVSDISTYVKNAVYFTVNSTSGTKYAVSYVISIVYFQDEIDVDTFNSRYETLVEIDDNWYIRKEFYWGT